MARWSVWCALLLVVTAPRAAIPQQALTDSARRLAELGDSTFRQRTPAGYRTALQRWTSAARLYSQSHDYAGERDARQRIGLAYDALQRPDSALIAYHQALRLIDPDAGMTPDYMHFAAGIYQDMARAFLKQHHADSAVVFLLDAMNITAMLGGEVDTDLRELMARTQEALGHPDSARAYRLGQAGPPPRIANVMIGVRASLVRQVLGEPEGVRHQPDGSDLWAYQSRGLLLQVDSGASGLLFVLQMNTAQAGNIQGVRVGDPVAKALERWGIPSQRDGERLVFDRNSWYLAVVGKHDTITAIGTVLK